MNRALQQIVDDVTRYAENPGDGYSPRTELQVAILESGENFDEGDMLEAARQVGVPEDELLDWLEDHASWLGGENMDPKPRPNPDPEEPEDEEDDAEYCDCEDDCEEHEKCGECGLCVGCCCECKQDEDEE